MGAFNSRRSAGVEEIDYSTSNAYRYPPKSGCYFGSYFIMGGERFDTTQPEAYLFGENQDLNFLGNRPVPFPYPAPQANEPTKTLKSLVNIRKDSVRFIKVIDDTLPNKATHEGDGTDEETDTTPEYSPKYNIEFTFDTDVRVAITIFYFATEEISNGQATYHPRDSSMNSETYHYKRGANQTFSQSTHIIEPLKFPEEEWMYNTDKEVIPVVIQCVVEDEVEHAGHSHMTFGTVEKTVDGTFVLKPLKQKQMVDGLCYLLQEIYGIENKNPDRSKIADDDIDDMGNECVICMSDIRDTLILPCRHLCLCNGCADSLRYQANNCPICRAPFRALLQIRAMRKKLPNMPAQVPLPEGEDNGLSQENVPPGYEAVALIEALNGPNTSSNTISMPANGVPPVPMGTSLPTSPEESPVLDKRKNKQNSSIRSRRSNLGASVLEEGEEVREEGGANQGAGAAATEDEDEDGQTTPEVKMLEEVPDPVKPADAQLPRRHSSKKKKKEPVVLESESEIEKTPEFKPRSRSKGSGKKSGTDDIDIEAGLGAEADGNVPLASPGSEYEDAVGGEEVGALGEVTFNVTYEKEGESDAAESEPLCLPATTSESSNLPDTPVSTSDGSSYSSTSSTRNLLTSQTPSTRSSKAESEDEKAIA